MLKNVIVALVALALSAGSAFNAHAGGGSVSAVKKNAAATTAQAFNKRHVARHRFGEITEFSSSSSAGYHSRNR